PARLGTNRDWVIPIECNATAVLLPTTGQEFALKELQPGQGLNNPLYLAVKRMIERRQATVRPDELPYRPQLRFFVTVDGFRAYYLAYPALEYRHIPMNRELKEEKEEK